MMRQLDAGGKTSSGRLLRAVLPFGHYRAVENQRVSTQNCNHRLIFVSIRNIIQEGIVAFRFLFLRLSYGVVEFMAGFHSEIARERIAGSRESACMRESRLLQSCNASARNARRGVFAPRHLLFQDTEFSNSDFRRRS